jgi:hypothetical protein
MSTDTFECGICYETVPVSEERYVAHACKLRCCKTCIGRHALEYIRRGNGIVRCPASDHKTALTETETVFGLAHVASLSEVRLYNVLRVGEIVRRSRRKRCPTEGCLGTYLWCPASPSRCVVCSACRLDYCAVCETRWHGTEPCPKKKTTMPVPDPKAFEARHIDAKSCPGCKALVSKEDGCNQVVCGGCKLQFCWTCLLPLNEHHPQRHVNVIKYVRSQCALKNRIERGESWQSVAGSDASVVFYAFENAEEYKEAERRRQEARRAGVKRRLDMGDDPAKSPGKSPRIEPNRTKIA